jgi:hypothetical protein
MKHLAFNTSKLVILCIGILSGAWAGAAYFSGFELKYCKKQVCVQANSKVAQTTNAGDVLFADNIELQITSIAQDKTQSYSCHAFSYDLASQLLTCENIEPDKVSLIIDAQMNVKKLRKNI